MGGGREGGPYQVEYLCSGTPEKEKVVMESVLFYSGGERPREKKKKKKNSSPVKRKKKKGGVPNQ